MLHNHGIKALSRPIVYFKRPILVKSIPAILCVQRKISGFAAYPLMNIFMLGHKFPRRWKRKAPSPAVCAKQSDTVTTLNMTSFASCRYLLFITECTTFSCKHVTTRKQYLYKGKTNSTQFLKAFFQNYCPRLDCLTSGATGRLHYFLSFFFTNVTNERITESFLGPNLELIMGKFFS